MSLKFKAMMHGREITGDVVNPGEWFGMAWVVECGLGNFSFFYAVEAGNESEAIDALCDSEEFGHIIRVDPADVEDEENQHYAGNAGEPVNLDNVMIHGSHKSLANKDYVPFNEQEGCSGLVYCVGDIDPVAYTNR